MPRYFTLAEANEVLNVIRPLLGEALAIRRKILTSQPEVWEAVEKSAGNGGNKMLSGMVQDFSRFDVLIHQILATGVYIKDINIGLLDFPAVRKGRDVYLCWMDGEETIAFWHEVDEGLAGRQPIETF